MSSGYDSAGQANADRIEKALYGLRRALDVAQYRDFWNQVKVVSQLFKTLNLSLGTTASGYGLPSADFARMRKSDNSEQVSAARTPLGRSETS